MLRLVPGAGHALGVHLDRDELRAVLVDLDGTVVAERRAPLDLGAGAETLLEGVARAAEELAAEGLAPAVPQDAGARPPGGALAAAPTLLGLGAALPGPLDHVRGVLHRVTGFPEWDGYPLRDALERRLGVPVVVDKDTNAAALGLAVGGAGNEESGGGAGAGSFAYLHLGTGLGAGLVFGGGVHRGPGPAPGSSGTRSSSSTGRPAPAAPGAA